MLQYLTKLQQTVWLMGFKSVCTSSTRHTRQYINLVFHLSDPCEANRAHGELLLNSPSRYLHVQGCVHPRKLITTRREMIHSRFHDLYVTQNPTTQAKKSNNIYDIFVASRYEWLFLCRWKCLQLLLGVCGCSQKHRVGRTRKSKRERHGYLAWFKYCI